MKDDDRLHKIHFGTGHAYLLSLWQWTRVPTPWKWYGQGRPFRSTLSLKEGQIRCRRREDNAQNKAPLKLLYPPIRKHKRYIQTGFRRLVYVPSTNNDSLSSQGVLILSHVVFGLSNCKTIEYTLMRKRCSIIFKKAPELPPDCLFALFIELFSTLWPFLHTFSDQLWAKCN